MKRLLPLLLLLLSGCVSHEMAQREIARCPEYFQGNIGEIKIEPLSPWSIVFKGYVHVDEPNCPSHLLALADKHTLLEEAFHSFELRAFKNRYKEWKQFYYDFHADGSTYRSYGGLVSSAIMSCIPFIDMMPIKGKVNFHSTVSHLEDTAECFIFWMQSGYRNDPILMQKCEAVAKFANGGYSQIGQE